MSLKLYTGDQIPYDREEIAAVCSSKPSTQALQILRYNPQIQFVADTQPTIKHKRLSVFVHGFGGSGNCVTWMQALNPSDYITFHLPDHTIPGQNIPFFLSSFGGENEILPFIYVLNLLLQQGITAVDLVGLSRGGAVIINALSALLDPSKALVAALEKLGIGANECNNLLQLIQNGTLILWHPLRDVQALIKEKATGVDHRAHQKTPSSRSGKQKNKHSNKKAHSWWRSLISSIQHIVLPALTAYRPWAHSVSKSLKTFERHPQFKCKILVILQPGDAAVGNVNEGAYIEALPSNKEDTYIAVGVTPGHLRYDESQLLVVNAFRHRYGASYDKSKPSNDELLSRTNSADLINVHASIQHFLDKHYQTLVPQTNSQQTN